VVCSANYGAIMSSRSPLEDEGDPGGTGMAARNWRKGLRKEGECTSNVCARLNGAAYLAVRRHRRGDALPRLLPGAETDILALCPC
jgi:hypothetical protein